jgi:rare lipoprotein A (peptidoglycan hydrolase)
MKLTERKPAEKNTKKLKLNIFNIKSLLVFNRKKLDKIKKEKKKFSLFQMKKKKVEEKEKKIESPRTIGSTLKNIGGMLLAKPLSIIDKLKELFGIILLGILVNNLPMIVKKLQDVLGKIKKFFEDNPWIGKVLKFAFDIIAKGMMGILELTKTLMPVIGGSFKFALDTIKTAEKEIGKAITLFNQLDDGIKALMTFLGYKPPAKAAQAYARSKGKYYSSTTGKTYANYKTALQNPAVKKGAQQYNQSIQQRAQKAQAAPAPGYNPNTGTSLLLQSGTNTPVKGAKPLIMAPITRNGTKIMGVMDPNDKSGTANKLPNSWQSASFTKQERERYQAVNQAQKVQKLSVGGTIRNFFGNMFGFGRGIGNIPPSEGTGRGSPSDVNLTTKSGGQSYASPYASPAGTAKGRKARETVNYFKMFENNVNKEERTLIGEEKNLKLLNDFMKSYNNLLDIRKKYKDTDSGSRRTPNDQTESPDDYDPGAVGGFASGAWIGPPGDTDGEQTGLNMNLPGGIGTPIYAPRDLIYKKKGTKGGPSVGLQGTPDALGPSGHGFGFYGAYFFKEKDKEYEVLMGHFRDMPYKGTNDGEVIPKGTLLGYQGASGRSISSSNGVYPHISLHLNGVGFRASNQELVQFANSLRASGGTRAVPQQKPNLVPSGQTLSGQISWYGPGFYGKRTASGSVYTGNELTAAHKSLPFGTKVKITSGSRSVIVTITDRGPYVGDRVLDLSPTAMEKLKGFPPGTLKKDPDRGGVVDNAKIEILKPSTQPQPNLKPGSPQAQMNAQSLRTNITNLMRDLGVDKKIFGQQNLSLEIIDGKLEIKDTRGIFGTGLFQSAYDTKGSNLKLLKDIQNYLQYELNKKRKSPEERALEQMRLHQNDFDGGNASVTVIDRPTVAVIEKVVPQPVPGPTQIVPIYISQNSSASRSLRSTLS